MVGYWCLTPRFPSFDYEGTSVLMMVIPETRRAHYIWYIRLYINYILVISLRTVLSID
jgi:hypothetical protein